jgi:hypothetical protein
MDVLDFFLSKHAVGIDPKPRSSGLTSFVSKRGKFAYFVKDWMGHYEFYRWDDNYIMHRRDASIGPANVPANLKNAKSFIITPGLWMKRDMKLGERIDMVSPLDWYDGNCRVLEHWDNWTYSMILESEIPNFDAGALGRQNVIVLRYFETTVYERYFYSKEWGWIRWEAWDAGTNKMTASTSFYNPKAKLYKPTIQCGDPQPPPIPKKLFFWR